MPPRRKRAASQAPARMADEPAPALLVKRGAAAAHEGADVAVGAASQSSSPTPAQQQQQQQPSPPPASSPRVRALAAGVVLLSVVAVLRINAAHAAGEASPLVFGADGACGGGGGGDAAAHGGAHPHSALAGAEDVFWHAWLTAVFTGLGVAPFLLGAGGPGRALQPWLLGGANALAAGMMLSASLRLLAEGAASEHLGDDAGAGAGAGAGAPPMPPPLTPSSLGPFGAALAAALGAPDATPGGTVRVLAGLAVGVIFLVASKRWLDAHEDLKFLGFRGLDAKKILLILGVMTLHSATEGIGIGVSFGSGHSARDAAAAASGCGSSAGGGGSDGSGGGGGGGGRFGEFISAAMAVHNVPEGLATSLVLVPRGTPLLEAFLWAVMTSLPQPLFAVPAYLFVTRFAALQPLGLGFAAGAMSFVALRELVPEAVAEIGATRASAVLAAAFAGMWYAQLQLASAL